MIAPRAAAGGEHLEGSGVDRVRLLACDRGPSFAQNPDSRSQLEMVLDSLG